MRTKIAAASRYRQNLVMDASSSKQQAKDDVDGQQQQQNYGATKLDLDFRIAEQRKQRNLLLTSGRCR